MTRKRRDTSSDRVTIGGVVYMALVDYAYEHGMDVGQLRRNARGGNVPLALNHMGTWLIPEMMDTPVFASRGPRTAHDGKRFVIYVPETVSAAFMDMATQHGITVVDPATLRADRKRRKMDVA